MNDPVSEELRRWVRDRAEWTCEYCLLHEDDALTPHQIDHVINRKHGGLSLLENLALACLRCNSFKGSNIASLGLDRHLVVSLFHPRRQRWIEHFEVRDSFIQSLTDTGATSRLLRFNSAARVEERMLLIRSGRYPGLRNRAM